MPSRREAAGDAAGSRPAMVWASPEVIEAAGIEPWSELPIWAPADGELASLHDGDVSAAYAAGLACRPVEQTVADTWRWLQQEGYPPPPPGRPEHYLSPDKERRLLDGLPR